MGSTRQENDDFDRPQNDLLRLVNPKDFKSLLPYLDQIDVESGQALYHPDDGMESVYFPCAQTVVSLAIAVDEDREIEAVLVGREGAVGGIVNRQSLPSYSRMTVKIGGPIVRISARRLDEIERQSYPLRNLFTRYAECLTAQICQSAACNAAHSIEQRAAKWIIDFVEHTGNDQMVLTHEQFAVLLGVGRSYASRVLQGFRAEGILDTSRGTVRVRHGELLRRKSCRCNMWVKKHFAEILK